MEGEGQEGKDGSSINTPHPIPRGVSVSNYQQSPPHPHPNQGLGPRAQGGRVCLVTGDRWWQTSITRAGRGGRNHQHCQSEPAQLQFNLIPLNGR